MSPGRSEYVLSTASNRPRYRGEMRRARRRLGERLRTAWPMDADIVVLVAPAGRRDPSKFTGSRFTVPTRIARLPAATGNHNRRAPRSGAKLDGNRRVGILGEHTQRRRAIGA
jgi:hypothetical protein